jgi:hypothetical protein
MTVGHMTLAGLNRRHHEFWETQNALMQTRMADDAVLTTALADLKSETDRRIPSYFQKSFVMALQDAAAAKRRYMTQLGQKGGRTKKSNTLQELIEVTVRSRSNITESQLLARLRAQQGIPPIQDIDDTSIWFTNHDGTTKETKVSGLKDRLSRAKRKSNLR